MPRMWVGDSEIGRIQELAIRGWWLLVAEIGERDVASGSKASTRATDDVGDGRSAAGGALGPEERWQEAVRGRRGGGGRRVGTGGGRWRCITGRECSGGSASVKGIGGGGGLTSGAATNFNFQN